MITSLNSKNLALGSAIMRAFRTSFPAFGTAESNMAANKCGISGFKLTYLSTNLTVVRASRVAVLWYNEESFKILKNNVRSSRGNHLTFSSNSNVTTLTKRQELKWWVIKSCHNCHCWISNKYRRFFFSVCGVYDISLYYQSAKSKLLVVVFWY